MPWWEFVGLCLLLAAYLIADALFGRVGQNFMNIVGPLWLTVILGLSVLRMVRSDFSLIWTALVWFRLACASYYGFGSLVPLIINDEARARILTFYRFFGHDLAKANVLFALGIIVTLASANLFLLSTKTRDREEREPPARAGGKSLLFAGLAFLAVGAIIKYTLVVPDIFGVIDFTLPGSIKIFGRLTSAALFLLTAWSWRYARGFFPFVVAFAGLEMLIGLLAFTKAEVLISLMMFLLGILSAKVTVWRLVLAAGAVLVCYFTIIPLVNFGRAELWKRYGELGRAHLAERIDILAVLSMLRPNKRRGVGLARHDPAEFRQPGHICDSRIRHAQAGAQLPRPPRRFRSSRPVAREADHHEAFKRVQRCGDWQSEFCIRPRAFRRSVLELRLVGSARR